MKKSDEAVIPMMATNKGAQTPAESSEGRASTKGNPRDQSTYRTQGRGSVSQAVERVRQAATRKPQEKLTALLHHITTDALRYAFYGLKQTATAGVDGLVWKEYEDGLEERLLDLHGRVHSGAYRALPSRRVAIPKPDGGTRPLGIASLEDKIVQKAVVDVILTPIYEPAFLGFSYGFRPGRGHTNLETAQGATPHADARRRPRDGAMVGEGGQRLAELLRRADQLPDPWRLRNAS